MEWNGNVDVSEATKDREEAVRPVSMYCLGVYMERTRNSVNVRLDTSWASTDIQVANVVGLARDIQSVLVYCGGMSP